MSFETWNHQRLEAHKTTHLLHHPQYEDMQELHNQVVYYVNNSIWALNRRLGVSTPHVGSIVLQPRAGGLRFRCNRLVDGCHPRPWATEKIVIELASAINENRLAVHM